ncbi:MAG: hypothetical protein Q9188_004978, partial [Gyalolechia gomerana]
VADLEVRQRRFLDLGHLSRDLFEDLAAPFFARRDRGYGGDGAGAAGATEVEDPEVGGLGGAEAEEHRLGFFAVAGLEGLGGSVGEFWGRRRV